MLFCKVTIISYISAKERGRIEYKGIVFKRKAPRCRRSSLYRGVTFVQFLERGLRGGGVVPDSLARALAAARRSSLYGSRTRTQLFGTVKLCSLFRLILWGYFSASRVSFWMSLRSWVYMLAVASASL